MVISKSSDNDEHSPQSVHPLTCQGDVLYSARSIHCYFCSLENSLTELYPQEVAHKAKIISNNFTSLEVSSNLTNFESTEVSLPFTNDFMSLEPSLTEDSFDLYQSCHGSTFISFLEDKSPLHSLNETLSDVEELSSYNSFQSVSSFSKHIQSNLQSINCESTHFTFCVGMPSSFIEETLKVLLFTGSSSCNSLYILSQSSINHYLVSSATYNHQMNVITSSSKSYIRPCFISVATVESCFFSTYSTIILSRSFSEHEYINSALWSKDVLVYSADQLSLSLLIGTAHKLAVKSVNILKSLSIKSSSLSHKTVCESVRKKCYSPECNMFLWEIIFIDFITNKCKITTEKNLNIKKKGLTLTLYNLPKVYKSKFETKGSEREEKMVKSDLGRGMNPSLTEEANRGVQLLLDNSTYLYIFTKVKDLLRNQAYSKKYLEEIIKGKSLRKRRTLSLLKGTTVDPCKTTRNVLDVFKILTKTTVIGDLNLNYLKPLSRFRKNNVKDQSFTFDVSKHIFSYNNRSKKVNKLSLVNELPCSTLYSSKSQPRPKNISCFGNELKVTAEKSLIRTNVNKNFTVSSRNLSNSSKTKKAMLLKKESFHSILRRSSKWSSLKSLI